MIDNNFLVFIPLLPLLGAILSGIFAFSHASDEEGPNNKIISFISCLAPAAAFLIASLFFLKLQSLPVDQRVLTFKAYEWIHVGNLNIDMDFLLDPLSSMMTIVITFIGTLIHIYSVGYMAKDRSFARYFSYLNLFTFSMLMLVLGKNLPIMFLGWEGVGLCSYLLIGFWFTDSEKAIAGNKAFITNRIGDFGFLLGVFLLFWSLQDANPNSLDFVSMKNSISLLSPSTITAITLLFFIGAMGKSAQIPLHVWLPDAMAGPTPVSALIHAATMVTAGIYMIVRLNFLYSLSPATLSFIETIGLITAFFAATVAITQSDIKKVLAYSTVSQLGYMFLAAGVGAYSAASFHLFTHAFFKALLFLGSGSVIHAMSEEQNIWKMGGLWSKMKITGATFLIGTLAISGIPPFAGFFSKDEILFKVWESGNIPFYIIGLITSGLTAFYMFRLFFLVFMGSNRNDDQHVVDHIHESPMSMTLPLIILAICSTIVGFLGIPHLNMFESWLEPVIGNLPKESADASHLMEYFLIIDTVIVALIGISLAYVFYIRKNSILEKIKGNQTLQKLHDFSENKWYFDELYNKLIIKPLLGFSDVFLFKFIDKNIIDGLVNGTAKFYSAMSYGVRDIQSGKVRYYAYFMLFGIIMMFVYTASKTS
ncbi:MAG: NADH-quinone oxidoreductase subunit L [Candidatus Sericytochromatia bacterium]|nr:NADH-quinone oxidoreductase subunit L [Candidatus Sericytochromatia bacterium]